MATGLSHSGEPRKMYGSKPEGIAATSLPQPHSLLLALCVCAHCMFLVLLVYVYAPCICIWTVPRPIVPFFVLLPSTSTHHQSCWFPLDWEGRSYIPTRRRWERAIGSSRTTRPSRKGGAAAALPASADDLGRGEIAPRSARDSLSKAASGAAVASAVASTWGRSRGASWPVRGRWRPQHPQTCLTHRAGAAPRGAASRPSTSQAAGAVAPACVAWRGEAT